MPVGESKIEADLRKWVHSQGGECLKWVSPGRVGVPDRILLFPGGDILFVEVKTKEGKLSPMQVRFHKRLRQLGFRVITYRGV